MNHRPFRYRAFISALALVSFLLSALSGIVLFVRPEGSLAAWTGWSFMGLDKKEWERLHAALVFLLITCVFFHVLYNWRALATYLGRPKERGGAPGALCEFAAAGLLSGLVLWGTLGEWIPLRWIPEVRAAYKSGTGILRVAPPVADSEELPLAELCPVLGVSGCELLEAARRNGVPVADLTETLGHVAARSDLSPQDLFILLRSRQRGEHE